MASVGPQNPTAAADNGGAGSVWSNPTNVFASDDSRATNSTGFTPGTNYINITGFDFSGVPVGATIDGIEFNVERQGGSGTGDIEDASVKVIKGGTISGNESAKVGVDWLQSSDHVVTYGGATEKFGLTWTDTDVKSDFGIAISAKRVSGPAPTIESRLDHVTATVYYTAAAGGSTARSFSVIT